MVRIDYFFSPISPYTYLAGDRLERIAGKHGAEIAYRPFQISQVFDAVGTPAVKDRHPSRQAYRLQDLARVAKANGMPINLRPRHWPTNPVPAMSAIIGAEARGGGDLPGLVRALLAACWAEEKDIATDDVIEAALEAHGFPKGLAFSAMLTGSETIAKNTQEALDRGVFGAPTYVVGDQLFWGQDRLGHLDTHLSETA